MYHCAIELGEICKSQTAQVIQTLNNYEDSEPPAANSKMAELLNNR